jgi:hypothetical protein
MAVNMEAHALAVLAADLVEKHGAPKVLDVEHSIHAHKPTLSGTVSPSSYYLRPPDRMSADELIKLFEATDGFEEMRLTLTSILGIDTYHQPIIAVDDFAKKYFSDSQQRIVRVVGKSNPAIEAMAAFIEGLKRPFDASQFPHHEEFMVSGYRAAGPGVTGQLKLLFKPADPTQLMKIERKVKLHFAEVNLGPEIGVSRHYTREQPPELILASLSEMPKGHAYLEALASSLPRATAEELSQAIVNSNKTPSTQITDVPKIRAHFGMTDPAKVTIPREELLRKVTSSLSGILKHSGFAGGVGIKIVQGGSGIDVEFPRSARSLWLSSTFDERKDIHSVKAACVAVKSDPVLREGWELHYRFDTKEGKLQLRIVDPGTAPSNGAKVIALPA